MKYSKNGYKRSSKDKSNPYNIIPSGDITMKGVDFPVHGTDNLGYSQTMLPGFDYTFPGTKVFEVPLQNFPRHFQKGSLLPKAQKGNEAIGTMADAARANEAGIDVEYSDLRGDQNLTPDQAELVGGFFPLAGEIIDGKNVLKSVYEGNYGDAVLHAAGFAIPFVPGKAVKKGFDKVKGWWRGADNAPYQKMFDDRTVPIRGGVQYDDGIGEYNSLKSMHKLYPDNIVEPLDLIMDDGVAVGYNMKNIPGEDLMTWTKNNKFSQEMYDEIANVIDDLNSKGLYHGDLNAQNIIIDNTGNWKIIDPVGFEHSSSMSEELLGKIKDLDSESLEDLKRLIKKYGGSLPKIKINLDAMKSGEYVPQSQKKSGGEEKSIDDQSEREWLKNWLNARKETGRFDDQLNEDDLAKYINNINTVQQITRDQSKKMFPNSNSGYLSSLNSPAGSYTMDPDNPNVHHYFSDPTLLQSFTNMFDSLDNEGSTKVHELTHAMTRIEGSDQLREAFPNKNWKDYKDLPLQQAIKNIPIGYGKWYNDPDSFDVYERDPEEILAQLMEYRKNFNVDPNRIFTEDDIEEVKKNVKKQGPSGMFGLNIFTPENTIRLLNEVAQAEPSNEMDLGVSYAEFGGDRTTALRNFMYDKKRNKLFKADDGGGFGSWLKGKWDANKDTIQKYADYASYVPVIGKAAGFVSAGIDGYDAYQAYQAGDMETYKKERNKALTTAAFSGTPGQYVKGAIKSGIKQVTPQLASKTAAHVTKTGIKDTTKELQDTTEKKPIIDSSIPTGVNVKDPRDIASTGTEIDETRQLAINQKTNEILNQIENDWDMKTQQNRNNVTSKTNMPGVIQFIESTPTFSQLSNISETDVLGLNHVDSPFKYKYYINKNKNSDINKKYLNNISINSDISKIEEFRTQQSLMTAGYYGKDNWENYNFVQHNDVVKLQKELVNNGYDIGDSNNEIVNRTVEERYKNKGVDAKYGPKTSKAYSDFELNKLNLKDKNIITASYYNDLEKSKDINWKFNSYNSKNKKFNYNIDTTYNQEERMSYIESVDGIMSPLEYQDTEDILNFMDTAIPEMAKDMLIQVDHNWVTTTVLSMIKEKTPIDLSKIDPAVLEYFDINDFNIKDDPKKLAIATAYNVMSNYSKIKEHLQDENVSEDQIRNASTFGLGKKYENKRPNQYFDQEVLEHQLMTAANLRTLLQDETVTNKNKILSKDMSQEIFLNEANALNIVQEDIDKMINTSPVTEQSKSSLGGEIKKPKYTGKYAKYGYQLDSEWKAKKEYESGGDIDLNIEKKLLNKGWIKPKKNKRFKMSALPTHIILNSLDLKFMKRGGDYPDMETKIKIYDDYLNGVFDNMDNQSHKKKAKKIVDKLNRFYMYEARDGGQHVFDYMKSQLDTVKNK